VELRHKSSILDQVGGMTFVPPQEHEAGDPEAGVRGAPCLYRQCRSIVKDTKEYQIVSFGTWRRLLHKLLAQH